MWVRSGLFVPVLLAALAPVALSQPRPGVPPPPLFLPPPLSNPQGLAPLPNGYRAAPYNGLPPGHYTGVPSTYPRPNPLPLAPLPPLVLETPANLPLRPGQKLPTIDVLFPGPPRLPRMPEPTPPGPVIPVTERK